MYITSGKLIIKRQKKKKNSLGGKAAIIFRGKDEEEGEGSVNYCRSKFSD